MQHCFEFKYTKIGKIRNIVQKTTFSSIVSVLLQNLRANKKYLSVSLVALFLSTMIKTGKLFFASFFPFSYNQLVYNAQRINHKFGNLILVLIFSTLVMQPDNPSKNNQSEHLSSEISASDRALDKNVNQSSGMEQKDEPQVEEKIVENSSNAISIDEQQNKIEMMKKICAEIEKKQAEEKEKYIAEQERKKKNKAKKVVVQKPKNEEKDAAKKLLQEKKQKIENELKNFVNKYKKGAVIDLTGSEIGKFKSEQKQKLFKNLMMGLLEIKFLEQEKITPDLQPLHQMDSVNAYTFVRKLSSTIDECLMRAILYPTTNIREKRFKSFYRELNNNLVDQENFELRSQILTNKIEPKQIPKQNEDFFYSAEKKKRISQRNSILLNQCEAPPEKVYVEQKEIEIDYGMKNTINYKKEEEMNLQDIVASIYYDKSTLEDLTRTLKGDVPQVIRRNIEGLLSEEKYKKLREALKKNYLSVFKPGYELNKMEEQNQ